MFGDAIEEVSERVCDDAAWVDALTLVCVETTSTSSVDVDEVSVDDGSAVGERVFKNSPRLCLARIWAPGERSASPPLVSSEAGGSTVDALCTGDATSSAGVDDDA